MRRIDQIVLHHTVTEPTATVEEIRRYHVDVNHWSDVFYHHLVRRHTDGRVEVQDGRPVGRSSSGSRPHAIEVAVAGHYSETTPLAEPWLWGLTIQLLARLCRDHGLTADGIRGHREVPGDPTECPGLLVDMDQVRSAVRRALAEAPTP